MTSTMNLQETSSLEWSKTSASQVGFSSTMKQNRPNEGHNSNDSMTMEDDLDEGSIIPTDIAKKESYFQPFRCTLAYEKGIGKLPCGLCKMFFHKASVCYKVPNHRLLDQQKKWNFTKEGARYRNAAFLYKMVTVCTFCYQFFQQTDDDISKLLEKSANISSPDLLRESMSRDNTVNVDILSNEIKAKQSPYLATVKRPTTTSTINTRKNATLRQTVRPSTQSGTKARGTSELISNFSILEQSAMLSNELFLDGAVTGPHTMPETKKKVLELEESIHRTDLAQTSQRIYQSSELDGKDAAFSIANTSNHHSKTKREVDPWLELDFGRPHNICEISFDIYTGINMQMFHINVILLDSPVGFEDPFLSSVSKRGQTREFCISPDKIKRVETGNGRSALQSVCWNIDPHAQCSVVRIQLKGIYSLSVGNLKIFQGDGKVDLSSQKRYEDIVAKSYATMSPMQIRKCIREMSSPDKLRMKMYQKAAEIEKIAKQKLNLVTKTSKMTVYDERKVDSFSTSIKMRYVDLDDWKMRVTNLASIFSSDEIKDIFHLIFKYTYDSDPKNKNFHLDDNQLLNEALIEYYPRCNLRDLETRIKQVVRWIQTRTNLKLLNTLIDSDTLWTVAENPTEPMYRLQQAFARTEKFWDKLEEVKKRKANKKPVDRECSWSQFLVIMSLLCSDQSEDIPLLAFNMDVSRKHTENEDLSVANTSVGSKSLESRSVLTSIGTLNVAPQAAIDYESQTKKTEALAFPKGKYIPAEFPNYIKSLEKDAKEDQTIPHYNSSFAEYKFAKFKKRIKLDDMAVTYPKKLSLEFVKSLKLKRGKTSSGNIKKREEEMSKLVENESPSAVNMQVPSVSKLSLMLEEEENDDDSWMDEADDDESYMTTNSAADFKKPNTDFFCICGLCGLKFPKNGCLFKVMRKHIVKLRSSWNPKLISKEVRKLDNTISMYNLVNVCTFCSQFFDPDFNGGIAFPEKGEAPKNKAKSALEAIQSHKMAKPLEKFYDNRYQRSKASEKLFGKIFERPATKESRDRAKKASSIALSKSAKF